MPAEGVYKSIEFKNDKKNLFKFHLPFIPIRIRINNIYRKINGLLRYEDYLNILLDFLHKRKTHSSQTLLIRIRKIPLHF